MKLYSISLRTVATLVAAVLMFGSVISGYALAEDHVIEIRNLEFIPKNLSVSPGDRVTWINHDFVPHTVTADDESWDSGLIKANGKWEMVIVPDSYNKYFCRYHPNMKAGLTILQ